MEIPRITLKRSLAYTVNSKISMLVIVGKVLYILACRVSRKLRIFNFFVTLNTIALWNGNIYVDMIWPGNVISIFIVSAIFYIQCHTVQRYFGITKGTIDRKCHKMEFKQSNVEWLCETNLIKMKSLLYHFSYF